jgi:hypothetical protein
MDWIKRNLYFLIGGVAALALMGMAGWFLFSKWQANNAEMDKLNTDYQDLQTLNNENPHPGSGQINNIKIAEAQQEELRGVIEKAKGKFEPIAPIPNVETVSESEFAAALSRTVDRLQKEATNSSVIIPPNYRFSFEAQYTRVSFASNSIQPLSLQLGDVQAICNILFEAKVNALDNIRRSRVSTDDTTAQMTDYIDKKPVTNDLAILAPYEVTFRSFSAELAAALAGFASSPYGIVVKSINVEPGPAPVVTEDLQPALTPQYIIQQNPGAAVGGRDAESAAAFQRRYGVGGGGRYGRGAGPAAPQAAPPPQTIYVTPTATPAATKPQTVLDERQLKVTLTLAVVRLRPPGEAQSNPAPPTDQTAAQPTDQPDVQN